MSEPSSPPQGTHKGFHQEGLQRPGPHQLVILSRSEESLVAGRFFAAAQNDSLENERFWKWVMQKTSLCKTHKGYPYHGC